MAETQQSSATIETVGGSGYHLVRFGTWEVTVRNDGMVTLPGLVRPEDIPDLCGALVAAQKVGEQQREDNEKAQADAEAFFAKQRQDAEAAQERARRAVAGEDIPRDEAPARDTTARAARAERRSRAGGPRAAARQPRQDPAAAAPAPKKRSATQAGRAVDNAKAAPAKKAAAKKAPARKAPAKKAAKRSG